MMRFVVAGTGFTQQPDTSQALIEVLCTNTVHSVLVLDGDTIAQRAAALEPLVSIHHFIHIPLSDWLRSDTPDVLAIRTASQNIPPHSIIVLDSTGHTYDQTSAVLLECQKAWFHLDEWHRAFVLLCDDLALYRFAAEMVHRFYIPPETLLDTVLTKKVRYIQRKAWLLRWFGHGRRARLGERFFDLKDRLIRRLLT